jgi:ribonuclease E
MMMINVTHAEESRVAIVADGILEAFEIETFDHKAPTGNISRGRVEAVQPGLQAAFVDIGGARGGFLPLDEVNFKIHPPRKEGNRGRLENHLHKGQELLVQVVRDAYGTKPPTLSTYFSLPGRYLVLTPYADTTGISRKLDDKQRERLRKALDSLALPESHGVIVRTAGASSTKIELARDLKYLLRVWENIEAASKTVRSPKLIYQERSLVIRTIRDLFTPDIDEILVDDAAAAEEIVEFFDAVLPQKKTAVKLYQGDRPIFNKFNLEEQIENIFRRRVPLPSGGAVVFDATEALTAVDVNSGKMTHEGHIEDTALKANLEAAAEISRQMRLRDLGGLVVIDFIDMRASKNVRQVEKAMKDALRKDKARYDVTRISSLGLLEISRERLAAGKSSLRYTDCPTCDGTGSIKTVEAATLQALRRLQTAVVRGDLENVEVTLPPEVAEYLLNQKRQDLVGWEDRYKTQIIVKSDGTFTRDRCEVRTVVRERARAAGPLVVVPSADEIIAAVEADEAAEEQARVAAAEAAAVAAATGGDAVPAAAEGEGGRKKRRRRRGGRKHRRGLETAAANGEPVIEEEAEDLEGDDEDIAATVEAAILSDVFGDGDGPGMAAPAAAGAAGGAAEIVTAESASQRKRRRRRRRRKGGEADQAAAGGTLEPAAGPAPEPVATYVPQDIAVVATEPAPLAATVAVLPDGATRGPRPRWWKALVGPEPAGVPADAGPEN